MQAAELSAGLNHFWGTDVWHRHPLYRKMLFTDGVEFFAKNAGNGAFWFLDIVGTELHPQLAKYGFINIMLRSTGRTATITADDGNDNVFWTREIEWTDCPAGDWQFFLENDVLCLPLER